MLNQATVCWLFLTAHHSSPPSQIHMVVFPLRMNPTTDEPPCPILGVFMICTQLPSSHERTITEDFRHRQGRMSCLGPATSVHMYTQGGTCPGLVSHAGIIYVRTQNSTQSLEGAAWRCFGSAASEAYRTRPSLSSRNFKFDRCFVSYKCLTLTLES